MIFRLMTSFSSTNYYNVRPHDLPTPKNLESFSLSLLLLLLYCYYHFINILLLLILFLYSTSSLEKIMWKCESAAASAQEWEGEGKGADSQTFKGAVCVCMCVCVFAVCVCVCGVVWVCVCVCARALARITRRDADTPDHFPPPFLSLKPYLFGPPMVSFASNYSQVWIEIYFSIKWDLLWPALVVVVVFITDICTVNVGHWEPPGHVYSKWVPALPLVGPPGLASWRKRHL